MAESHLSSHETSEVALAGQVLSALNSITDTQKNQVCNNIRNSSSDLTVKETFDQAEVFRYFGCQTLKSSVKKTVESVLSQENFASVEEFYFANQMNQNYELYGSDILNS